MKKRVRESRKGFPQDILLNKTYLGLRLREARETAEYSVDEAAFALQCEGLACRPQQMMDYEEGRMSPTIGRLQVLAQFYGTTVDFLTVGAIHDLSQTVNNMNRTVAKRRAIIQEQEEKTNE